MTTGLVEPTNLSTDTVAADSLLEGTGFEHSVPPRRTAFFETAPEPGDDKSARWPELDFDDRRRPVYRALSQAGPGNDINAGSPGFQKAPTRALPAWSLFVL
jgi:hypothetical protein